MAPFRRFGTTAKARDWTRSALVVGCAAAAVFVLSIPLAWSIVLMFILIPAGVWASAAAFAWVATMAVASLQGSVAAPADAVTVLFTGIAAISVAAAARRQGPAAGGRDRFTSPLEGFDGGYLQLVYGAAILTLFIASLRRSTPWGACLASVVALAAVWPSLPRRSRPLGLYLRELALAIVTSVLCLAGVEIGLRRFMPANWGPKRFVQPDSEYNFISTPDTSGWVGVMGPGGYDRFFRAEFSSQGFRDREFGAKAAGEIRVLMLGDSFTMGQVPESESIPKHLERICAARLPGRTISVVNGGLGNTGPIEQLGTLRRRGLILAPDLVVLQTFPGNDFQNCLSAEGRWLRAESLWLQADVQRWQRVKSGSIPFVIDREVNKRSAIYHVIAIRTPLRVPLALWLEEFRFISPTPPMVLKHPENRPDFLEPDLVTWYPDLIEAFEIFQRNILLIRDECADRDIAFRAYCLPAKHELFEDLWKSATGPVAAEYERLKACRLADAFFDKAGIGRFSVDGALLAAGPVEKSFYPFDGHLHSEGNRVVAERIFEAVIAPYVAGLDAGKPGRAIR